MTAARLPDFIFARNRETERNGGFVLAGTLVTDLPPRKEGPSEEDMCGIEPFVDQLLEQLWLEPDFAEAGLWRGQMPSDGLEPPFPDELINDRVQRSMVLKICIEDRGR